MQFVSDLRLTPDSGEPVRIGRQGMTLQRQIVAIVLCMVLVPESGFGADLSPKKWKALEKAQAELGEMSPSPAQARLVEGKSGLVTGTMSP